MAESAAEDAVAAEPTTESSAEPEPATEAMDVGEADNGENGFGEPGNGDDESLPELPPDEPPESEEDKALDVAMAASLVEELGRIKEEGNALFKGGKNAEAVEVYAKGIRAAEAASTRAKTAAYALLISLHSNTAAAQLKLEAWQEASDAATFVLATETTNSKCLFRRGVARSKLGQLSSAKDDLMAACRADPKDRNARTELASVQAALKTQREESKANFAQSFEKASHAAVAREEAKEAARKREAARVKAAEEAKLLAEWQADCEKMRAEHAAQREATRVARLKRFLGEDEDEASGAAAADGAAEAAATAPGAVSAKTIVDVSRWAEAELRKRLETASATDANGTVSATVCPGGIADVVGSASVVRPTTAADGGPSHFFEYAFNLRWKAVSKASRKLGMSDAGGGGDDAAWKEDREARAKAERERVEKLESEAKERASEARRRARKAEKVVEKDADLKDVRGYKIRADGSKTSYFDRQLDEHTKALLDAQKAPKRLSVGSSPPAVGAAGSGGGLGGSAWNNGTTWEEKDTSEWAKAELEKRLTELRAADPSGGGEGACDGKWRTYEARVTAVKEIEGSATIVATRGSLKHSFEYGFEVEWRVTSTAASADEGDAADAKVSKGKLKYAEVASTATAGSVCIGSVQQETKTAPAQADKRMSDSAVTALQGVIRSALEEFDKLHRTKTM